MSMAFIGTCILLVWKEVKMRAWVEIEMDNLVFNINQIKKQVQGMDVMAVVKANSYGFGSIEVVREFEKNGVKLFAVACLDEALELREAGFKGEILVLGILLDDEIEQAAHNNIQITVGNWEQIKFIEDKKLNVGIHIKVDTGMGRLGFEPWEGEKVVNYCLTNGINIMGIYSHLSDADGFNDDADKYTFNQISKFSIFEKYKDRVKYIHILNSGGIFRFNKGYTGNLVRAGICMYGMIGSHIVEGLKRVFTVKTRILAIKKPTHDTYVSYGRQGFVHSGETYVVIGMGYADGIKKDFTGKSYVIIAGEKCPLIGEICMDMCMAKIPDTIKDKIALGDEVIVLRDDIIRDMTIDHKCSCDLVTGIGRRVYRVYRKNGKPYLIDR